MFDNDGLHCPICHQVSKSSSHLKITCTWIQRFLLNLVVPQVRVQGLGQSRLNLHHSAITVNAETRCQQRMHRRNNPASLWLPAQRHVMLVVCREWSATQNCVTVSSLEGKGAHSAHNVSISSILGNSKRKLWQVVLGLLFGPNDLVQVRVHAAQVDYWCTHGIHQSIDAMNETSCTCTRLCVTNARLSCSQVQGMLFNSCVHQHRIQGANLNGITKRRSRAVHLDKADITTMQSFVLQCRPNHHLLRRTIWSSQGT
mmetsp:Transcript_3297/g.11575  ORF Transcript_3297/g.11575 Transcript_3297/m.11575 type:complete len:257 (+) Transcript_3297:8259-9029(+)